MPFRRQAGLRFPFLPYPINTTALTELEHVFVDKHVVVKAAEDGDHILGLGKMIHKKCCVYRAAATSAMPMVSSVVQAYASSVKLCMHSSEGMVALRGSPRPSIHFSVAATLYTSDWMFPINSCKMQTASNGRLPARRVPLGRIPKPVNLKMRRRGGQFTKSDARRLSARPPGVALHPFSA